MVSRKALFLIIGPATALVLRLASEPTANLSYLFLATYALFGRAQAIQALALSWLFGMLSPGFVAEASVASVGRYAVIAAAVVSVFLRNGVVQSRVRVKWPVLATILLGVFLIVHSFLVSPIVDISVLKATSWLLVTSTLFSAWGGLSDHNRNALVKQIFTGLIIVLVVSIPLLIMPLGYLKNGTGFQGIFGQPQAFGITMALLSTWAFSHVLEQRRPQWRLLFVAGLSLVFVFLSEARTGGLAMFFGLTIAVIIISLRRGHNIRWLLPGLASPRVRFVILLSFAAAILAGPTVADQFSKFLVKRSEATHFAEIYDISRGDLIRRMWVNIEEHPMTGTGFGIASQPRSMVVVRDPLFGIPTSASIEKGVMPIAVLEEIGVFGFIFVALWVVMLLRRATRTGLSALAVVLTALLLNMGEYTFFSPGGFGMITLVLFGWAAVGKRQRSPNV